MAETWGTAQVWRTRDDPFPVVVIDGRYTITVEPFSQHDRTDWREENARIAAQIVADHAASAQVAKLRAALEPIVEDFTADLYCANCSKNLAMCQRSTCLIGQARAALAATVPPVGKPE